MAKAFRYALKHSLPILISYIPVALAYGVLMQNCGYNFVWTGACSIFVLAGSLQYLMVTFFAGGVSLLTVAIMSLLLNSRHIFYGLSFIEKFRTFGPWKYFLIYSLTDENYSLHCSHHFESDVNEKWAYVLTAFLSISYWIILSIIGALIGSMLPFNTTGIDFALTALFIVILIEQILGADNRLPAWLAFVSAIVCLLIFGPSNFILPSLVITVALLSILRHRIEPVKAVKEEKEEAEMVLTTIQSIAIIAVCGICTLLERALPFLIFSGRAVPEPVRYLGRVLPMAIMATLVIYCLKGISFSSAAGFAPLLIASAVTAILHLWKRSTLISIFCGTVCYMVLVQLVFA